MEKGTTKSLYVKSGNLKFCERISELADGIGSSFSDIMNEAIRQAYYQERTGVWISPGAYLAIANGQLEALECVRSRNGGTDLVLRTDAPSLARDGMDSTYPGLRMDTAYSIGEGMLRKADEPGKEDYDGSR